MTPRVITNLLIGIVPLASLSLYLITYNARFKKLGKKLLSDSGYVELSFRDFVGPVFILISLGGLFKLNSSSILNISIGVCLIIQRLLNRKQIDEVGLFQNGIILENGLFHWKKVHSINPKKGYTDILLNNGTCLEYRGRIKSDDIFISFNKWKQSK